MRARLLLLLVAAVGCGHAGGNGARVAPRAAPAEAPAVAPPTYPLRVARLSDEALARSERALRARSGETWTEVQIDPYGGLLRGASIVEPEPDAAPASPTYDDAVMRERWSRFLSEHADELALDAPGMEPIPEGRREIGFQQVWGEHVVGDATVSWHEVSASGGAWRAARILVTGHGWPVLPPAPTVLDADELAAQLVGRRGARVVRFQRVSQPCDPPGNTTANPCGRAPEPAQPPEVRVAHALTRADLIVGSSGVCRYVAPGASSMELRLVVTMSVRLVPAAVDAAPQGFVASVGFAPEAPLPQRLDAVTGETLDAGACDP